MLTFHASKGWEVAGFRSDYATAINDLRRAGRPVVITATQPLVLKALAGKNGKVVVPAYQFNQFVTLAQMGCRYFILDPQAYISYTDDDRRFSARLRPFLNFILEKVPAEYEYEHFSPEMFERFVLEHNEDLAKTTNFLKQSKYSDFNRLYVYDLKKIIVIASYFLKISQKNE